MKVVGIDIWGQSEESLKSYISGTGVTFPIAKGDSQTLAAYGAGNNEIFLINQQGILKDRTSVTETQTDSTVNTIAAKISKLLNNVEVSRKSIASNVLHQSTITHKPVIEGMYDLRGRKLEKSKMSGGLLKNSGFNVFVK